MTRVAIMQPTYLPWIGYFGLMSSVDIFIYLDSVQFARRSWQQRNQIKTAHGPLMLTIPVLAKGKRDQIISDVEVDVGSGFAANHMRSIQMNYKKAPHYDSYEHLLMPLAAQEGRLVTLTTTITAAIRSSLGIETPLLKSSEMNGAGHKGDLLVSLCEQVGATEYVSPPGSRGYLEETDAFERAGISVSYFNYVHPEYSQLFGDFVPYMSAIDLIFNCGPGSRALIDSGIVVD